MVHLLVFLKAITSLPDTSNADIRARTTVFLELDEQPSEPLCQKMELNKLEEDTLHRQMTDLEVSSRKKLQED